jgi:hypothetical protein
MSKEFLEAQEYMMKNRWKVVNCTSGEDCWCKLIQAEVIPEGKDEDYYILNNYASLSKQWVEYIVELHNNNLKVKPNE